MAFDLASITEGPRQLPPRLLIYGPHGVGKTTFGCGATSPVVIPTEDGLGMLETPAFPLAASVDQVMEAIGTLAMEEHTFKTVVLDSADWLDNMIQRQVRETHSDKELAYGKDALLIAETWRDLLDGFNTLRTEVGMAVILIAHCEVKRFDPPDGDSYERYQPKLMARSSALVQEWADAVLFANTKTLVKSEEVKNGSKIKKPLSSSGERTLHTGEQPAYLAKNRYGFPPELAMDWDVLNAAMPVPF